VVNLLGNLRPLMRPIFIGYAAFKG